MFLFFSRISQDTRLRLVVVSPLVPLVVTVSYRASTGGTCLMFFSWWGRLMCFREEDQRGRVPFSAHTKCTCLSAWLTSAVNLDHLAGVTHSSSFSMAKLLFPSPSFFYFPEESYCTQPTVMLPYLRSGVSIKITWYSVYLWYKNTKTDQSASAICQKKSMAQRIKKSCAGGSFCLCMGQPFLERRLTG